MFKFRSLCEPNWPRAQVAFGPGTSLLDQHLLLLLCWSMFKKKSKENTHHPLQQDWSNTYHFISYETWHFCTFLFLFRCRFSCFEPNKTHCFSHIFSKSGWAGSCQLHCLIWFQALKRKNAFLALRQVWHPLGEWLDGIHPVWNVQHQMDSLQAQLYSPIEMVFGELDKSSGIWTLRNAHKTARYLPQ